ncbi:thioesterase family protein [Aerococcaceae bacterium zg-BR9]|uniref:thioesterase family protein n=1 Tax=Aerococcaceae bacterium zg-1292 TaxID=2774330 RepID=UPI0040648CEC|nr:thioesterase family protein [Aerococcaceae bacterium zg-BR9]
MSTQYTYTVEPHHAAAVIGSGGLDVLSTPMLIAYMENAAYLTCQEQLDDTQSTVGAQFSIQHLAPSAIHDTITVNINAMKQDGRQYHFELSASDLNRTIATATHTRVIILKEKFMARITA